jgi:hypothetical protein
MKKPDDRNDVDWRRRRFAAFFCVCFLSLGVLNVLGRWGNPTGYWQVGLGLAWFAVGLVHHARWQKRDASARKARA